MYKKFFKIAVTLFLILVAVLVSFLGVVYYTVQSHAFAIQQTTYIYVDEPKDYAKLLEQLQSKGQLKNTVLFNTLAKQKKYPQNMKTGRFAITPQTSYLQAVYLLRGGRQTPVKLTFNNIRLKSDFVRRIGEQLMLNPDDLLMRLNDENIAASYGFDTTTFLTMFIPNTYEMYWNLPVDKFLERMKKEYTHFWTKERLAKAEALHLSPAEIAILASIVEEETNARAEYPVVAGLYLNRLKKGMLLQADPTVKFAVGDVTLRRILHAHLQVESPYNTYIHRGLPPGPIRIPSITVLDAVLNYREHDYIYMCAKEDFSGTHNFAVTFSEHTRNAQKYQRALNTLGL
ncbi:MAG: endolytic transglycosylase MltG [Candidatus Symbiothrix sp.]|jgi:UPF0755 protein|nr:endolytic transglycosylase MltG [Candidatus Symbiothrix sp.]